MEILSNLLLALNTLGVDNGTPGAGSETGTGANGHQGLKKMRDTNVIRIDQYSTSLIDLGQLCHAITLRNSRIRLSSIEATDTMSR